MTGTGIPLDNTESHHTLTSEEKREITNRNKKKQRSCLMKFTGFGAAGRAGDRITDDEIEARSGRSIYTGLTDVH